MELSLYSKKVHMRIGITGGLGVIGQALAGALRKENIDFVLLDNAKAGEFFGNINNNDDLERFFNSCDGIVHLAGISNVRKGELDPQACYQNNVLGTLNLLDYISKSRPTKWLLFISSREVYGAQQKLPVNEWAKCNPINQYGLSKLLAEDLVRSRSQRLNINYAILRLSNVFGTHHDLPERVIPKFFQCAINEEDLVVCGTETTCDFIHIQDVIASFLTTIQKLQNKQSLSPINICSGHETRLVELANIIVSLTCSNSSIRIQSKGTYNAERFVGSNIKANTYLGWSPTISLYDALQMYFDGMKRGV